jgi:drug/metabolite transporter (DMT)-like permease
MARSDTSFVSPFLYCTLIFAALYDGVVFEVMPGFISLLGAGIVLAGAALLAWREALSHGRTQPSSVIK